MARLIDADKLKAHYAWWADLDGETKKLFDTIIDLQPTVEAEPKRGQTVRNANGEFVPFTCSCWHANPTEGDKHHNGRCTKYYDCIRTRENDPFPTMGGKTHKTYCVKRMDEVEE